MSGPHVWSLVDIILKNGYKALNNICDTEQTCCEAMKHKQEQFTFITVLTESERPLLQDN